METTPILNDVAVFVVGTAFSQRDIISKLGWCKFVKNIRNHAQIESATTNRRDIFDDCHLGVIPKSLA
jgi:hypothetical protein